MSEGELVVGSEEGELELGNGNNDNDNDINNTNINININNVKDQILLKTTNHPIKSNNILSKKKWKGIYSENDFIFDGKIGEGTFGQVYKAKFKNNPNYPHHVALKVLLLRAEQEGFPITAIREIKLLRNLKHPNIIELLGIAVSPSLPSLPCDSTTQNGIIKLPSTSSLSISNDENNINTSANVTKSRTRTINEIMRKKEGNGNKETDAEAEMEEEIIPSGISMIFPYMDHDLTALLEDPSIPNFSLGQIKLYSHQLLSGLEHLHRVGILHRDIKGANILVDNRGQIKITDFGLARPLEEGRLEYTPGVVTRWYRPPELLLGSREYGPEVDIWGIGCIITEMFTRKPLLPGSSDLDQIEKIVQLLGVISEDSSSSPSSSSYPGCSKLPDYSKINWKGMRQKTNIRDVLKSYSMRKEDPSPSLVDLISQMLELDPKRRITCKEALSHRWFTEAPKMSLPHEVPTYRSRHDRQQQKREMEREDHQQQQNQQNHYSDRANRLLTKRPPHMTPQKHGEHESNKSFPISSDHTSSERGDFSSLDHQSRSHSHSHHHHHHSHHPSDPNYPNGKRTNSSHYNVNANEDHHHHHSNLSNPPLSNSHARDHHPPLSSQDRHDRKYSEHHYDHHHNSHQPSLPPLSPKSMAMNDHWRSSIDDDRIQEGYHYSPFDDSSQNPNNLDRYIPDYSLIHPDYPENRKNWNRDDFFREQKNNQYHDHHDSYHHHHHHDSSHHYNQTDEEQHSDHYRHYHNHNKRTSYSHESDKGYNNNNGEYKSKRPASLSDHSNAIEGAIIESESKTLLPYEESNNNNNNRTRSGKDDHYHHYHEHHHHHHRHH